MNRSHLERIVRAINESGVLDLKLDGASSWCEAVPGHGVTRVDIQLSGRTNRGRYSPRCTNDAFAAYTPEMPQQQRQAYAVFYRLVRKTLMPAMIAWDGADACVAMKERLDSAAAAGPAL